MSTRHLVDPELLPLLDTMPAMDWSVAGLSALRGAPPAGDPVSDAAVSVETLSIPSGGDAPDIRALLYRPQGHDGILPAVLSIHGGGFIIGNADMLDATHRRLAVATPCVILSPDYRLAPETAFPGAIDDCYAALGWLHANADTLGIDRSRVAVSGVSAGGGLAACLILLARDRGEYPVAFQHLLRPMLDDRTASSRPAPPLVGEFVWTGEANRFGWGSLLGGPPGGPDVSPYASAARGDDLSGLPPTFLTIGALDLFLEEVLDYGRRLIRAGIPTELHVHPGVFHGSSAATGAKITIESDRISDAALRAALTG